MNFSIRTPCLASVRRILPTSRLETATGQIVRYLNRISSATDTPRRGSFANRGDCEIVFVVHPNPELIHVAHEHIKHLRVSVPRRAS